MKKVLYIIGNPQTEAKSYSKRVGKYYLEELKKQEPLDLEIVDVYRDPIPLVDLEVLEAWDALKNGSEFSKLTSSQQGKIMQMNANLKQFMEADEYVFISPVWNLSITPMLKAYIDNVVIANKTFKYTEMGPEGLLKNKKATIIQAAGSVLSDGPLVKMNYANRYLETILRFMGIEEVNHLTIEGVAIPGTPDEKRFEKVYKDIKNLLK